MILRKLVNNVHFFLHVYYVQSTYKIFFKIWEMVKKAKTKVDRLHLVSKIKEVQFDKIFWETLFHYLNQNQSIYIHFHLLYPFPNLDNKILCILDTNMWKLDEIVYIKLLLFSSITILNLNNKFHFLKFFYWI